MLRGQVLFGGSETEVGPTTLHHRNVSPSRHFCVDPATLSTLKFNAGDVIVHDLFPRFQQQRHSRPHETRPQTDTTGWSFQSNPSEVLLWLRSGLFGLLLVELYGFYDRDRSIQSFHPRRIFGVLVLMPPLLRRFSASSGLGSKIHSARSIIHLNGRRWHLFLCVCNITRPSNYALL